MDRPSLVETLRGLERRLLRPEVRSDAAQLGKLLHPSFTEVGAGGRTYSRDEVLAEFRDTPPSYAVWAQDFQAEVVLDDIVMLKYKSAHIDESGKLTRFVLRTSLWQRTGAAWQVRFHQGTPTDEFEKHAT
jgi:hypothetical protein